MKIGLISINTRVTSLNFACPLHTYAFQQFLLQNGIESTVIDYKPSYYQKNYDPRHPLFSYIKKGFGNSFSPELLLYNESYEQKGQLKGSVNSRRETVQKWIDLFYEREIRYDKFQEFIDNNYIKTDKCYDWKLLDREDPGFDCYICVTDVIWKNMPNYGFDKGFFLACKSMEGKKKIAYSASRGPFYGWSDEVVREFLGYIEPFDFISVREPSLKEHIESISDKKVEVVLDPVFLQDKEFYHKLAIPPKEKNYVLIYDVMEKATDTIVNAVRFAEARGLKVIQLSDRPENAYIPAGTYHEVKYGLGIEEWLGYIENADYIFTNSFHCCCFSMIFEKEFFAGKRNGDKVTMVLDTFGLNDRRLDSDVDVTTLDFAPIDYEPVHQIWKERKEASAKFILNAIHSVENDFNAEKNAPAPKKEDIKIKYRLYYHSGTGADDKVARKNYKNVKNIIKTPGGAWEYRNDALIENEAENPLQPNGFSRRGYSFLGWNGRISVGKQTYWYCTDGNFHSASEIFSSYEFSKYLFKDGEVISKLSFPAKDESANFTFVMQAVWAENDKRRSSPSQKEKPTEAKPYRIYYHSGTSANDLTWKYSDSLGEMRRTPKGAQEYLCNDFADNEVPYKLIPCGFSRSDCNFIGWNGRTTVDKQIKWYCTDGKFHSSEEILKSLKINKYLFKNEEEIVHLPLPARTKAVPTALVMEAVWAECYHIIYRSETGFENVTCEYSEVLGTIKKNSEDSLEYHCNTLMQNGTPCHLLSNGFYRKNYKFLGWNGHTVIDGQSKWYCIDGSFRSKAELAENAQLKKYLFKDCETISNLPFNSESDTQNRTLIMDAVWTVENYYIRYHSGTACDDVTFDYLNNHGETLKNSKGAWVYHCNIPMKNGTPRRLQINRFNRPGFVFVGWNGRISVKDKTHWYCTDGLFHSADELKGNPDLNKYLFYDCEELYLIPIPANSKGKFVLEAVWKRGWKGKR